MDINNAIVAMPELKGVEADLQVIETMCGYISEKKPLKETLQEVRIMSGWTPESIKASCKAVMEVVAMVFEREMNSFNEEAGADVDSISLDPFKQRFEDEVNVEQANLKIISARVMEMASRLALALNIPVPASNPAPSGVGLDKPKKSFVNSILKLVVVEGSGKKVPISSVSTLGWLTEPILKEESESVQKLILLDNKFEASKSADSVRLFASKFKLTDADLAEVILDVLDDARKQIAQCDQIVAIVTASYVRIEKIITVLLAVRNNTNLAMNYVSGKNP
jgi:hypothetical protein